MIPEARPAIIIASWRCGGTFLCHCLSNHPDIFCVRGEPMHHRNIWRKLSTPAKILDCVFGQHHYAVSMAKLTYTQAFHKAVWPHLIERQPKVIWLYRENLLRQAVSLVLVKLYHKGLVSRPVHALIEQGPVRIKLDPEIVLTHARGLMRANEWAKKRLEIFGQVLELTYADVVGGEQASATSLAAGQEVCKFLEVPVRPMESGLKRINPYPLQEMLANWEDIELAVHKSEFAALLEEA